MPVLAIIVPLPVLLRSHGKVKILPIFNLDGIARFLTGIIIV